MVVMSQNRVAWTYTDDGGTDYRISAKNDYIIQHDVLEGAKQGGVAAASTVRRLPKDVKPRMVKMTDVSTGNIVRWLVCYNTTCDLWATPGTTFNMAVLGASVSMHSSAKWRGEKSRDTTTQSS
jgi:hypothetical protein